MVNDEYIIAVGGRHRGIPPEADPSDVMFLKVRDEWLNATEETQVDDRWQNMPPLLHSQHDPPVAYLNGRIFALYQDPENSQEIRAQVFNSVSCLTYADESDWSPEGQWSLVSGLSFGDKIERTLVGAGTDLFLFGKLEFERVFYNALFFLLSSALNLQENKYIYKLLVANQSDNTNKDSKPLDASIDPLRLTLGKAFPDVSL